MNAPVAVLRPDRKYDRLNHTKLKRLMTSAYRVMDALLALECRVGRFEINGDLPGDVVERLDDKFKASLPTKVTETAPPDPGRAHTAIPIRDHATSAVGLAPAPIHVPATTSSIFSPCLLYTSPSPRDRQKSRMPSSA